ncbi:hypothetical protein [Photobacterium leiognathi]|uniref:hypothetical protein n=1 Tax=Photobacterium leiognathi TaxID=553611 RepID=UPI00273A57C9|nr:hypothetical protein [Photobacterium leiognathi]
MRCYLWMLLSLSTSLLAINYHYGLGIRLWIALGKFFFKLIVSLPAVSTFKLLSSSARSNLPFTRSASLIVTVTGSCALTQPP